MARLEVLNPQARTVEFSVKPAPRLRDWQGVTIGLYWNIKAGGEYALDRTEQLLREKFPGVTFKRYNGSGGWPMRHRPTEGAHRHSAEVPARVGDTQH